MSLSFKREIRKSPLVPHSFTPHNSAPSAPTNANATSCICFALLHPLTHPQSNTMTPPSPLSSAQFFAALKARRSVYALKPSSPISDAAIRELVETAINLAPTAYNSQTSRVALVFGDKHKRIWNDMWAENQKTFPNGELPRGRRGRLVLGAGFTQGVGRLSSANLVTGRGHAPQPTLSLPSHCLRLFLPLPCNIPHLSTAYLCPGTALTLSRAPGAAAHEVGERVHGRIRDSHLF